MVTEFYRYVVKAQSHLIKKYTDQGFHIQEYQTFFLATKDSQRFRINKTQNKTCGCQEINRIQFPLEDIRLDTQLIADLSVNPGISNAGLKVGFDAFTGKGTPPKKNKPSTNKNNNGNGFTKR